MGKIAKNNPKLRVFGYSESDCSRRYNKEGRVIRFVALCKSQREFVDKVLEYSRGGTRNWIRKRLAETGNRAEVELAYKHPGKVLVFQDLYPRKLIKIEG